MRASPGLFAAISSNRSVVASSRPPRNSAPAPARHQRGEGIWARPPASPAVSQGAWERLVDSQPVDCIMGVHISGMVAAIAALPGLAAWALRHTLPLPLSLVLWHISGSGMLVAAAATESLAGRTTGLLGKRPDGTIDPMRFTLLWPYHVGLRTKLALQRRFSSEPSWDQITSDYYIGAWPSEQKLVPKVHAAVLDITCELPLQVVPPAYLNLAVWDTHAPTPVQIEQGVQWALQQRAAGRPVLVHCAHGHGRSATVLGAILVAEGMAKGALDAEALMKAQRPRVRLNRRQKAALKEWVAAREGSKQE